MIRCQARKRRQRRELFIAALLIASIAFLGWFAQTHIHHQVAIARAEADSQLASQSAELGQVLDHTAVLEKQLEVATATAELKPLSEEQVRAMVTQLFPKEAVDHFMTILHCENGTHAPDRVNINKAGLGYDLGIAQINSKWHTARVEKMFGQPFDVAMKDPWKNLSYAAYMYKHAGNFHDWVCNKLI